MKKFFAVLLFIGTGLTAAAQQKGSLEIGANVGYNLSTVTSGSNTNSSYRSGFNVSGFADVYLSDRWSIKTKLSYDQKGWDEGTFYIDDMMFATDFRYDYLTIPVMANWHFGRTKNWYLNFGPYAGILLKAQASEINLDLKELSNTLDVGLALGIGVKIPVADRVKVLLEADGQAGITDVVKDNQGSKIQNSRSALNVGLAFTL